MPERDPIAILMGIAAALQGSTPRADVSFLETRGWLPFGKNAVTGHEGWGKFIKGRAVIVDAPEALEIEGWGGKPDA